MGKDLNFSQSSENDDTAGTDRNHTNIFLQAACYSSKQYLFPKQVLFVGFHLEN